MNIDPEHLLACVELAILANGGFAHHKEWCECDPSVGACPCRYCAIHGALDKTFLLLTTKETPRNNMATELFGHWQPMETAPKTDRILLCIGGEDWAIGSWNRDSFDGPQWEDDGLEPVAFIVQPTHWMPLPYLPPTRPKNPA